MARCEVCGMEMLTADGCTVRFLHANGNKYPRIPVVGPGDFFANADKDARCGDCNAKVGAYLHWGCDSERCPACGRQLLSCDCKNVYVEGESGA